jgi:hypothetical protein
MASQKTVLQNPRRACATCKEPSPGTRETPPPKPVRLFDVRRPGPPRNSSSRPSPGLSSDLADNGEETPLPRDWARSKVSLLNQIINITGIIHVNSVLLIVWNSAEPRFGVFMAAGANRGPAQVEDARRPEKTSLIQGPWRRPFGQRRIPCETVEATAAKSFAQLGLGRGLAGDGDRGGRPA